MSEINVLSLHRLGDPENSREAVRSLEFMIAECRPDINCIVHDADLPFPDYLKDVQFQLIVLGPTFLCSRYQSKIFANTLKQYDFIKDMEAVKIALPQDDYDCSGILDKWLASWKVDRIYTVCPEHWDVLYPECIKQSQITLGYTGYISSEWIGKWSNPKPHLQRKIDVSYRASKLPPNFGSIGQLKWEIADNFKQAINQKDSSWNLDISVNPKDFIPGVAWYDFVEDSRFCLTTASGSSLLDPWNEIRLSVKSYLKRFPDATFKEVERECFLGLDRKYIFTALSPRNIEAAILETVQIATPGTYSGLLEPMVHYIPLSENCDNIQDVIGMMSDLSLVSTLKKNSKEAILSVKRLRRNYFVDEMISYAEDLLTSRSHVFKDPGPDMLKFKQYSREINSISNKYWKKQRFKRRLVNKVKLLIGS